MPFDPAGTAVGELFDFFRIEPVAVLVLVGLVEGLELLGHQRLAGGAPGGPEVDQDDLALEARERERLVGANVGRLDLGRRLTGAHGEDPGDVRDRGLQVLGQALAALELGLDRLEPGVVLLHGRDLDRDPEGHAELLLVGGVDVRVEERAALLGELVDLGVAGGVAGLHALDGLEGGFDLAEVGGGVTGEGDASGDAEGGRGEGGDGERGLHEGLLVGGLRRCGRHGAMPLPGLQLFL